MLSLATSYAYRYMCEMRYRYMHLSILSSICLSSQCSVAFEGRAG